MLRRLLLTGAGVAALTALAAPAFAQDTTPPSEALPPVVVEGEAKAVEAYTYGDPLNSGTSIFDAEAIETRAPGSGDVNQLLKALPAAHFSISEGLATRANLQDIRPSEVSISGGRTNENLFILDGVDASSRVDATNELASDYEEVTGASPQAFWVDSNLVGKLIVRDSNVSAEYGRFAGGVVEIVTRAPARAVGGQIYYNTTRTDMTSFKISPATRAALSGVVPDKPEYDKTRYGFSLDIPIGDSIRSLVGYSRSEAEVTYFKGANYANAAFGQRSLSENFLVKADADLPGSMLLSGQLSYTPYESEASNANGINNMVVSHGGGWTGRLSLSGDYGEADWKIDATFSRAETDRDGARNQYNVTRATTGIDWCTGTSCTNGFIGPLNQRETAYTLKGLWSQPLLGGEFRGGFDFTAVEAFKKRPFTTYAYLTTAANANTVCANPNEGLSCVAGNYALSARLEYRAYEAKASFETFALWGEQTLDLAGFTVRAGLRVENDTFLGNWNVSPRLSATRELPFAGMTLTAGVNRYYNRSFLGYALRDGTPGTYRYTRTATVSGADRIWSDNWALTLHSSATRYADSELDTPYSDELTLGVAGPLFGGQYRVRGVLRDSKDSFSRSIAERFTYTTDLGTTATYTRYVLTNEGESSYRGLHLEWKRDWGRHAFSVSSSFSETKTSNVDYFVSSDDELFESVMVYYQGQVQSLTSVLAENQREDYASPLIVNADWSSVWWDGRIKANVNARFRDRFELIDDTGVNISVGGTSYDVYDKVEYDPSVDFNLNVTAEVVRGNWGTVIIDARVDNLLDSVPFRDAINTAQPYQLGRTFWVGAKYRF